MLLVLVKTYQLAAVVVAVLKRNYRREFLQARKRSIAHINVEIRRLGWMMASPAERVNQQEGEPTQRDVQASPCCCCSSRTLPLTQKGLGRTREFDFVRLLLTLLQYCDGTCQSGLRSHVYAQSLQKLLPPKETRKKGAKWR